MIRPAFGLKCSLMSSQGSSSELSVAMMTAGFYESIHLLPAHSQQHSKTTNGITNSRHVVGHEILVQALDKIRPILPIGVFMENANSRHRDSDSFFDLVATCNVVMYKQSDRSWCIQLHEGFLLRTLSSIAGPVCSACTHSTHIKPKEGQYITVGKNRGGTWPFSGLKGLGATLLKTYMASWRWRKMGWWESKAFFKMFYLTWCKRFSMV